MANANKIRNNKGIFKENIFITNWVIENNLIALCDKCHIKTNFNRDYWKDLFQNREVNYA